ncbi:MAG: hypothetical protein EXS13_10585 [Planctomycetes bacterium]|nr:hypothetical protein [Planctomycetota bacterium]
MEEENRLISHQVSSKAYYDAADFARCEDQCRRGLGLDPGNENLQLTLGYSLLRQAEAKKLKAAVAQFEEMGGAFGADDWRVDMGLGMALQQLARTRAALKDPPKPAEVAAEIADLRARSRVALERAAAASGVKKNTPCDVPFHLALLDLDEGADAPFVTHALDALNKIEAADKVFAAQLSQPMGESERERTDRDRLMNVSRGQRLCRELAILSYRNGDFASASSAMLQLEKFGALGAADYFSRAAIREQLADDENAIRDYEKFIELSAGALDSTVGKAVTALTRLRARMAEKRTASPAGGP